MKTFFGLLLLALIIVVSAGALPSAIDGIMGLFPKSFSDDDITALERQITNHFRDNIQNDAAQVEEVHLIRKSPRELTGFIKLKVTALGNAAITQQCTADMASDTGRIIWRCGP